MVRVGGTEGGGGGGVIESSEFACLFTDTTPPTRHALFLSNTQQGKLFNAVAPDFSTVLQYRQLPRGSQERHDDSVFVKLAKLLDRLDIESAQQCLSLCLLLDAIIGPSNSCVCGLSLGRSCLCPALP